MVIGVTNFNILDSIILKFSGQKYNLALHLVEMDKDPNPECRPWMPIRIRSRQNDAIQIRIHNADPTGHTVLHGVGGGGGFFGVL